VEGIGHHPASGEQPLNSFILYEIRGKITNVDFFQFNMDIVPVSFRGRYCAKENPLVTGINL